MLVYCSGGYMGISFVFLKLSLEMEAGGILKASCASTM